MKRQNFPLIRLAPWEHLPGADLKQIAARALNVAPFEWRGRQFQIAARFADVGDGSHYLFMRDTASDDEANWIFGGGYYYDAADSFSGCPRLGLPGRLQSACKAPYFPFVRLFHFSSEELGVRDFWRVSVNARGIGYWIKTPEPDLGPRDEGFRLPVGPGEPLMEWSARDIRALVLQQIADPDSDASFALRWAHLPQLEQEYQALRVRRGTVEQMRHLLACAFAIQPQLQNHHTLWRWEVERDEQQWSWLYRTSLNSIPECDEIPLRLRAWKREILAHRPRFAPTPSVCAH